jgi:hypothetical protein
MATKDMAQKGSHPFMAGAQLFFEAVKTIVDTQATSTAFPHCRCSHEKSPDSAGASEAAKPDALEGAQPEAVAQASRLEIKVVNEMYVSTSV